MPPTRTTDEVTASEAATTQPTHGGHRPGAGRPPIADEPMSYHTVRVPDTMWALFQEEGDGNASAGLRAIVEDWEEIQAAKRLQEMVDLYRKRLQEIVDLYRIT